MLWAHDRNEVPQNMTKRRPERQKLEKLLPWHAARTLSRCEADLVERALAADAKLARCYELVRQELADTIYLNETLGVPSARAMEKLFAAIEAEEVRAPSRPRISRTPARLRSRA
jgi:hypothetical protein